MSEERVVIVIEPGAAALRERVEAHYREALKTRDQLAISTTRLLRASINDLVVARTDEKRPDFGRPLTEADVLAVIDKGIKQREESADVFVKGSRLELAERERAEAAYLKRYLPERLDREAIAEVARRLIAELGPDFRKVMPAAIRALRGKADGRLVQEVVKELTGTGG
jgi:uncharacterized protein